MASSAKRDVHDPTAASGAAGVESSQRGPGLDRVIQAQIGDKLRAMYGELSDQPIPDRLTSILSRLGSDVRSGRGS